MAKKLEVINQSTTGTFEKAAKVELKFSIYSALNKLVVGVIPARVLLRKRRQDCHFFRSYPHLSFNSILVQCMEVLGFKYLNYFHRLRELTVLSMSMPCVSSCHSLHK